MFIFPPPRPHLIPQVLLPIPICPLPLSKLVSWIVGGPSSVLCVLSTHAYFYSCIIPVMPVVLKLSIYRVINSITLQPPFLPSSPSTSMTVPPTINLLSLYMCGTVSSCRCVRVCVSQCAEVMAGAGLLAENLAPPVAAHFSVTTSIPVSVATV